MELKVWNLSLESEYVLSHRQLNCQFGYHSISFTIIMNYQKETVNKLLQELQSRMDSYDWVLFFPLQFPLQTMLITYVDSFFFFLNHSPVPLTPCFGTHCFVAPVIYHILCKPEVLDMKPSSLSIYLGSTLNVFKMLFWSI